jgi:hypothetical protein
MPVHDPLLDLVGGRPSGAGAVAGAGAEVTVLCSAAEDIGEPLRVDGLTELGDVRGGRDLLLLGEELGGDAGGGSRTFGVVAVDMAAFPETARSAGRGGRAGSGQRRVGPRGDRGRTHQAVTSRRIVGDRAGSATADGRAQAAQVDGDPSGQHRAQHGGFLPDRVMSGKNIARGVR